MKIALFTKYESLGANSRYRSLQFVPYLRDNGVSVDIGFFFSDQYLRSRYLNKTVFPYACSSLFRRISQMIRFSKHDIWLVEYELIPFAPAFFEKLFHFLGKKIVSDYDDASFVRYDSHKNIMVRFLLKNKIAAVGRSCDLVICGNSYLASYFKYNGVKNVKVLPTVLDTSVVSQVGRKRELGFENSPLRIGWIGSPSTEKYLNLLCPAFNILRQKLNIEIWLCGASEQCLIDQNPIYFAWSIDEEVNFLRSIDIGIMPLTMDRWSQGKCGLKLIQYGGYSIPAVASRVGVNEAIIDDGETGYLCDSTEDWVEKILMLVDRERRETMGRAAFKKISGQYSLASVAPKLLASLRAVNEA